MSMELNLEGLAELGWRNTRNNKRWDELSLNEKASLIEQWNSIPENDKLFYRFFASGVIQAYTATISA